MISEEPKDLVKNVAAIIDEEVKNIIDECYKKAKSILDSNMDVLKRCAELLIEKERINREEFEALFDVKGEQAQTV